MMRQVNRILGTISDTTLFGFLPLDIVMHLVLGAIITFTFLKITKSAMKAFIICFIVAIAKEVYDSNTLVASWQESIKDIIVTIIYPVLLLIVYKLKKMADQ